MLAEHLFISHGIKEVRLDDLCHKAGISKKTFYVFFTDKNDLVFKVTENIIRQVKTNFVLNRERVGNS